MPRVLIVRGHLVNPWELGPWARLPEQFEVSYLLTGSNRFGLPDDRLRPFRVRALRDLLPQGTVGDIGAGLIGDRYLSVEEAFDWAEIVHAEELSFWFAAQAAQHKRRHGFRLVQTVWETLPLLNTYRNGHARTYRRQVLEHTDLFLPATERAARALRVEGVEPDRIRVCPPGIDTERFRRTHPSDELNEHLIVSPGRLVWEKGHHDVMRAIATLDATQIRLLIVGSGPEERRLRAYARELGLDRIVELRSVPYEQMPEVFSRASAVVLASLPHAGGGYHPFGVPRVFWEEQFGLVLAEAMAAGVEIIASTCGAIPEVLAGTQVTLVAPGDWVAIAEALTTGPLSRAPGELFEYPEEAVERFSLGAAADRLADAYASLVV